MSKNKDDKNKKDTTEKTDKKVYKKPKLKVIKIDKNVVHATDSCGGCSY